jgi:predicted SnoaL-like aldol condensation-catalyzing enzyme
MNAEGSGRRSIDMAGTTEGKAVSKREKETALRFFELVSGGKPRDARSLFSPECEHHNPYLPAGMDALLDSIAQVQEGDSPGMPGDAGLDVKHVLAEGDLVAVHINVQSKSDRSKGLRQIHLFRFVGDKIVEYWDVTQLAPETSNAYRMF